MYIARVPNRTSPPAILLRESFREGGKVKSRTLANITSWTPERIEALDRALHGDFDHAALSEPTVGPVFGLLYVLKQVADQIGISAALGSREIGKLGLFLVLARIAHQGSRLSAVRWAEGQAVAEVLGIDQFDEDDLYDALDDLCERQEKIEQALYRRYLRQQKTPPRLFLYDVTSSYLEGEHNELGAFGYNRDGKRGKRQIVIGLLTDEQGEPLAVRVFEGNSGDPTTVAEQIRILQEQFHVTELVFVGDRGMVKSKGQQALNQAQLHYITALTDPQIRRLLGEGVLQLPLFSETICEVEHQQRRYVLRKNESETLRIQRRLTDKFEKLEDKVQTRNQKVQQQSLCKPEAGLRHIELWAQRHKLQELIQLRLEGGQIAMARQEQAIARHLELAGCYVITTDVASTEMDSQQVHDSYMALQRVERDFRAMKTGALEVRPIFVQKASRTRGHVFCCMLALKLVRQIEHRLRAAFGTTGDDPYAVTLPDALASLGRLCLLNYPASKTGEVVTKLPHPNDAQRKILQTLNVSLPKM
jgi:transposase